MKIKKRTLTIPILIVGTFLTVYQLTNRPKTHDSGFADPPQQNNHSEQTPPSSQVKGSSIPKTVMDFKSWLTMYESTPPVDQSSLISEGIERAQKRMITLEKLIRTNPAQALQQSLTLSQWLSLPRELIPYVEEPLSSMADVDVLIACGSDTSIDRFSTLRDGRCFETFIPSGKRLNTTAHETPVQGIRLGNVGALHHQVFLPLSGKDLQAARDLYPFANPDPSRCFATGEPLGGEPAAALCGGHLFFFADNSAMNNLDRELSELDGLQGPDTASALLFSAYDPTAAENGFDLEAARQAAETAAAEWSGGERSMYVIMVDFDDLPGQPTDPATLEYNINTYVSPMFYDMSYQTTYITCTVDTNTYRMPLPTTGYTSNHLPMHDHAYTAVTNAGVDLSSYGTICVYFNRIPAITFEGYASLGGEKMWLNDNGTIYVVTHELGHNYGSYHAHTWDVSGSSPVDPAGVHEEYGDPFDVMGHGAVPVGHLHVQNKLEAGWLEDRHIHETTNSGIYRIYRTDHAQTHPDALRGLRFEIDPANAYWIGYRQLFPDHESFGRGTYVLWQQANPSNYPKSHLLDMSPGSTGGTYDGGLALGQTWSDLPTDFHITPVQRGGNTPDEWIDIAINLGSFTNNSPPTSMLQGSAATSTRESVIYTVNASDPDGDTLAFRWDFGDGIVHGNAPVTAQVWTEPGIKTVRCIISDMKGGTATNEMTVTVTENLQWSHQLAITTRELFDVATDGHMLVVVGSGGFVGTSTNGIDWITGSLGAGTINVYLRGITHDGIQFITAGMDWDESLPGWVGVIYTSPDGSVWTLRHKSTQPGLTDVTSMDGVRVAVGSGGTVLRSTNGLFWNVINAGISGDLRNISHNGTFFCSVGGAPAGGITYISINGINWHDRSAYSGAGTGHFLDIEYLNGQLLAGGNNVGIHRSTDGGQNFSEVVPNYLSVSALAHGNGTYLAAGISGSTDTNLISADGINWRPVPTPPQNNRNSATFFDDCFITVGKSGSVWKSEPIGPSDNGWALWQLNNASTLGLNRDVGDDPDGDGSRNLVEYALGTDPSNSASVPAVSSSALNHLEMQIHRSHRAEDINYIIERNTNLLENTGWNNSGTEVVTDTGTNLTVRSLDPVTTNDQEFLRLKVELNSP